MEAADGGYAMWMHEETARQRYLDAERQKHALAESVQHGLNEKLRQLHERQTESEGRILAEIQKMIERPANNLGGVGWSVSSNTPSLSLFRPPPALPAGAPKNAGKPVKPMPWKQQALPPLDGPPAYKVPTGVLQAPAGPAASLCLPPPASQESVSLALPGDVLAGGSVPTRTSSPTVPNRKRRQAPTGL